MGLNLFYTLPTCGGNDEGAAYEGREHGAREDGALGGEHLARFAEREARYEDRHREAKAAEQAHARDLHAVHPARELGKAHFHEQRRHAHDAQRLAHERTEQHTPEHRVGNEAPKIRTTQVDLGVHEGKQGQDAKVHGHRDGVLHALQGRRHVVHHALNAHGRHGEVVLAQHVGLVVVGVVELAGPLAQPAAERAQADVGLGRQEQRQNHARQRGMDARVEHAHPQHDAHGKVGPRRVDARPMQKRQHHDAAKRRGDPRHVGGLPIERGDDHDGEDVVGDGERGEEHLGGRRDAVAQKRHDAQREGDVGCHGNRPAVRSGAGGQVHAQVDEGGSRNAAHRGQHGQGGLAGPSQLAHGHLVLELDAHEQEEDGHEEVIHELLERERGNPAAHNEAHARLEEVVDGLVGRRVGHDDGKDGREHHRRGGHGSVGGDLLDGVSPLDAPGDRLLADDALARCGLSVRDALLG